MCGKSIIEQVQEERDQRTNDEARRPELKRRLEQWRSKGYAVARLDRSVNGDVRAAEEAFAGFEKDVARLDEVQLRLNSLDVMGFPQEVLAIRQGLRDPDAAGRLEQQVAGLESKIEARKDEEQKRLHEQAVKDKQTRMDQYRQRIAGWSEKGYSTARFKGMLEDPGSDSIVIERRLDEYDQDIRRLLELGKTLDTVRPVGTEAELRDLGQLLRDPDAVGDAQAKVDALYARFYQKKTEEEKRSELQSRLEEYRQKGYKVGRLEGAADKPLGDAEALLVSYEQDVGRLFKLWDRLRALDRSLFPEEWEAARAMMNDPDSVAAVQKAVEGLEAKQAETLAGQAEEDRRLMLTARKFVAGVFEKMRSAVPDYLPPGLYMEEAKWEPHLSPDGMFVKGEVHPGIFSKGTGVVACGYAPSVPKQMFAAEAESARAASQFVAHCFVVTRAPPELVPAVRSFAHPNLSVYVFDLAAAALHFNEDDIKTKVYSEWFAPDEKIAGMKGAIRALSDKHGIFTRALLQQALGLQMKDMDGMLRRWMARNELIQVSKIRDEYSFMD